MDWFWFVILVYLIIKKSQTFCKRLLIAKLPNKIYDENGQCGKEKQHLLLITVLLLIKLKIMGYLSPQIEALAKKKSRIENSLVKKDNSCGIFQDYGKVDFDIPPTSVSIKKE